MASKRHWFVLTALLLVLGLLLAACVRPMPGEGDLVSEETPAEAYPAPAETTGEDTAVEGYPTGEEAGEAGLVPPVDEAGSAEAYPGTEEEVVEAEASESEAVVDESAEAYPVTEDEVTEGETTEGEAASTETTEGEAAEGEAASTETTEGEAAEGEAVEGEAVEAEASEGEAAETGRTHTVAAGETLYQIGMQYGMSWVAIADANDITNPNSLYPGQVLVIPDVETLEAANESSEAVETEATTSEETTTEEAAQETTYIVQFGDTLYSISYRFGVSMMDIARENELASFDQIYAGQELIIPQADAETETSSEGEADAGVEAVTSQEGEVTHVVQEGETVFTIAFKYHLIWTDLVEANEIASPYTVEVGQTLIIPPGD